MGHLSCLLSYFNNVERRQLNSITGPLSSFNVSTLTFLLASTALNASTASPGLPVVTNLQE